MFVANDVRPSHKTVAAEEVAKLAVGDVLREAADIEDSFSHGRYLLGAHGAAHATSGPSVRNRRGQGPRALLQRKRWWRLPTGFE
jgi:hypothetical protein